MDRAKNSYKKYKYFLMHENILNLSNIQQSSWIKNTVKSFSKLPQCTIFIANYQGFFTVIFLSFQLVTLVTAAEACLATTYFHTGV